MPNPKDFLDDEHVYVKGHVRRKHAKDTSPETGQPYQGHPSWFSRIRWYWRLLIILGVVGVIIGLLVWGFEKHTILTLGVIIAIFFIWLWRLYKTD